jgi:hypothetical protein
VAKPICCATKLHDLYCLKENHFTKDKKITLLLDTDPCPIAVSSGEAQKLLPAKQEMRMDLSVIIDKTKPALIDTLL